MARLISSKAVYQCHNRRNELVSICICASKINQRENPDGEDIWNWYNKNDAEGIRKSIIQGADPNFCGPVIIQKSLLHRTAECGKVEIAKVLLENGANPNMKDLYQRTPLHFAAENGHTDVVRLLLEYKADISATDMKGVNALILAANVDIFELLISNGIDIKSTDKKGQTALHIAALKGKCDIVKTLLKHGADHSVKDNDGNTPILNAINNGHNDVVKALIDAGVDIRERVLFYGGDSTLLHHAVAAKNVEVVKTLLDHGHPVDAVNGENWRAFDSACVDGCADIVELMLSRGANVNHVHGIMQTVPLHHTGPHYEVLEVLLKHKDINVNAQDRDGRTPIYHAAGKKLIINFLLLLKYGAELNIDKNKIDYDALLEYVKTTVEKIDNLMTEHETLDNKIKVLQIKCIMQEEELKNKDQYIMTKVKEKEKGLASQTIAILTAEDTKKCKLANQKHLMAIFLAMLIVLLFTTNTLMLFHCGVNEKTQYIQSIVSTSFTATGGYSSRLDWIKYGLEIDIPENALPSNVSAEINIYINVSLSGPFIFPDSDIWKMASPIYWIYTNNSRNFIKPIQLGLLHTARNFTNPFQLRMVSTAAVDGNNGKYYFSQIGGHSISNISYFGYIYLLNQPVGYCVQVKKETYRQ